MVWIESLIRYGIPGLSAVMLVLAWRVLNTEQKRDGPPRASILTFAREYMVFCMVLLAVTGLYEYYRQRQATDSTSVSDLTAQVDSSNKRFAQLRDEIRHLDGLIKLKLKFNLDLPDKDRSEITLQAVVKDLTRTSERLTALVSE